MAEAMPEEGASPGKKSRRPLLLGAVLAILGAGGGFYAVQSGMISLGESPDQAQVGHDGDGDESAIKAMPEVAFVPIDPIIISLNDRSSHLRFRAQLEVGRAQKSEVEQLMPRVVDVLNSYLRALQTEDLADGRSLAHLRAQMLRRVQIVTGAGRVNDLLIMEFVLN